MSTRTHVRSTTRRAVRVASATLAVSAACAATALGAAPAYAASQVGGVSFSSIVSCSAGLEGLEVLATSSVSSGSLARIYLQDVQTGTWVMENEWHDVSGFNTLIHDSFTINTHGAYRVYMSYAQSTSAGWQYSGEYVSTYYQRDDSGFGKTESTSCIL
jgi:hypothetical protein